MNPITDQKILDTIDGLRAERDAALAEAESTQEANRRLVVLLGGAVRRAERAEAECARLRAIETAAREMIDDLDGALSADDWSTSELRAALGDPQ